MGVKMMNRKIGLSFMLFNFISFVSADMGDANDYSWMGNMMGGNYGASGMGFGWLIMFLIIIVLVLLIIWLTKQIWKK